MAFGAAVARVTCTGVGTFTATSAGFGVPDACYIIVAGYTNNVNVIQSYQGVGFMCSAGQRGYGIQCADAKNPSNNGSGASNTNILAVPQAGGTGWALQGSGAFVTDGVQFNCTTNNGNRNVQVLMLKGVTNAAITTISTLSASSYNWGFRADFLMTLWGHVAGTGNLTASAAASLSYGWAAYQNNGTTGQQCSSFYAKDAETQAKTPTTAMRGGIVGVILDNKTTVQKRAVGAEITSTGCNITLYDAQFTQSMEMMALKFEQPGYADLGFGNFTADPDSLTTAQGYPFAALLRYQSDSEGFSNKYPSSMGGNDYAFDRAGVQCHNGFSYLGEQLFNTTAKNYRTTNPIRGNNKSGGNEIQFGATQWTDTKWTLPITGNAMANDLTAWMCCTFSGAVPATGLKIYKGSTQVKMAKGVSAITKVYKGTVPIF